MPVYPPNLNQKTLYGLKFRLVAQVHASQYAQGYRQNCGVMSENWFIDAFVLSICATGDNPSLRSSEYRIKYAEDQSSSLQSLYARTAEMLGTGRFQTDR